MKPPTKVHELSVAQALAALGSRAEGLEGAEAARRLRQFGPNHVEKARRAPAVLRLAREFTRFFSIILWLAAGLAFVADRAAPNQGMARLAYAIVVVILVSGNGTYFGVSACGDGCKWLMAKGGG